MSNLAAALAYAERLGAAVFPTGPDCKPGSVAKFPPFVETTQVEKSYFTAHDGVRDPDLIRAIWTRYPDANVSVSTGTLSGFFVLDIDAKGRVNGFEGLALLEAANGPLPKTWRTLTPSGGEHRYFRQPDGLKLRNKVGLRVYEPDGRIRRVYEGLDIRTAGGAVPLPPSRKPHGSYRWAEKPSETALAYPPAWLLKLALDPPPPPKPDRAKLRKEQADRAARYVEKAIDGECGELASMKPGSGRNARLFQASCRLGSLVGAGLLPRDLAEGELFQAASACGLVGDDGAGSVRATIQSGMRKGVAQPRELRA